MVAFVTVLGAFCLYLIVLPLLGLVGSVICRIFLPYLLGVGVVYYLLATFLSDLPGGILLLLALVIWCAPALCVRYWPHLEDPDLEWYQGHYRAIFTLLTFGLLSRNQQTTAEVYPFGDIAQNEREDRGTAEF